jgi:putative hydrolase of the HAD superfamily
MNFTTLFLDLDDTLYPHTCGLWEAVGARIQSYTELTLDVNAEEASRLRGHYLSEYGTTLNGLMHHHQIDPLEYLTYVHDVPVERLLLPDPELRTMLSSINIPRVVFTNAHREYAQRVLQQLGILDLIHQIIDILALDYSNKPNPESYRRALALAGHPPAETCVMVDDRYPNLAAAAKFGLTTVLVGDGLYDGTVDHKIDQITDLIAAVPDLVGE